MGSGGTLLQSGDSGATWSPVALGVSSSLELLSLDFATPLKGFLISDYRGESRLYGTLDGGATWEAGHTGYWFRRVRAVAGGGWILAGIPVLSSYDGGTLWTESANLREAIYGVAVTPGGFASAVGQRGQIVASPDGGMSWTDIAGTRLAREPIKDVCFVDDRVGFAAAERLLRTDDGGKTWNLSVPVIAIALSIRDPLIGCALSRYGILRTEDGGSEWTVVWDARADPDAWELVDISFADRDHGAAIGHDDVVLTTSDGGVTWAKQTLGEGHFLDAVCRIDADRIVVLEPGSILMSPDGGATWTESVIEPMGRMMAVTFPTPAVGVAVGFGGRILKTTDGGSTWESRTSGTGEQLLSVSFSDVLNGMAAGLTGAVLATADGGETWTPVEVPFAGRLLAVSRLSEDRAIVGGEGGTILRTESGGR